MNCRKLIMLSVVLLGLFPVFTNAQKLKGFLDNKDESFTWLGVDFTQARLIGDAGANAQDVVARQFTGINQVVVNEPKKYDIPGAFHHDKFTSDLSLVNKRNEAVNPESLKSESTGDFERLKPEDLNKLVKSYDFSGKHGIGVLFVMDGMNKSDKRASMYVTIIDMDKKNVLMAERYSGKAQGFSWRNYWAYTIYKVLGDVEDDYKKLTAKYATAQDPEEEKTAAAEPHKEKAAATKETKKTKKKG
ncbi:hypothetical protein [Chitinophaga sp. 212800010-3]|uniref:hypothetical protein n=1 Tax=unclassified Chitinophaga TaxID=2619133 RepID=UPI002E106554